jgi:hypothetical protein
MNWARLKSAALEAGLGKAQQPRQFMSSMTSLFFFVAFTAGGVLSLASAALLPEYAALQGLRAGRDNLAHQIDCEAQLATYNDRLIQGMQSDPVLMSRLMMRYANYQPLGVRAVEVESHGASLTVPERLNLDAHTPPLRPGDPLAVAGSWINENAATKTSLTLLGLGMMVVGTLMFGVRRETPKS